jgi:hypothetical protein
MAGFLRANQAGALGLSPGDKDLVTVQTPDGAKFRVARKVAPQFNAFLTDLHGTGYKLNPNKSGGYNYRTIAGTPKLSQHAYGNAIDLNWDKNPYGSKRFDLPANVGEIAAKHGIAWGGTWKNPDPMHFEVSSLAGGTPPANAPASTHMAANATNQVANGAPMATPIGGAPIAGGPVPLQQPNKRYSKLADMLMAQAAGAKVSGWGDALRAAGGAALGYSLGNKADDQETAYRSKLAEALSGASNENLPATLLGSGDEDLMKAGVQMRVAQAKPQSKAERFMSTPNGILDLNTMQMVPGTGSGESDKPIEINGRLVKRNPETNRFEEVYAAPAKPEGLQMVGPGQTVFDPNARKPVYTAPEKPQPLVSVAPGTTMLDPENRQPVYTAPDRPKPPIEVNGRLVQDQGEKGFQEVYTSPAKPSQLQAVDRKEIFDADEGAQAATNVIGALDKAMLLNDSAYSGPGAQTRGYISSQFGNEAGNATEQLQNVVLGQVLDNLKATFGAAPTEGERQILLDLQGSVNKAPEVRRRIFENAKAAANRRLQFNQERAGSLRSGEYFQPGYSPTAPAAAKTPPETQVAPPKKVTQQEFQALPSGARFIDPEGNERIKP